MTFHNLVDLEKLGYFLGKIKTLLNGKVDKENGKGLSTNDYTTAEKSKLEGIASGAQVNVLESVTVNGSALPVASKSVNVTIPTKMSDLTNDGDYVSDANYVHTDTNYTAAEKSKLAGIASGAQVNSITGVKGDAEESYRTGNVNITKSNVGLGNVENKSSADIRGELTKKNVTDALGYTPVESETTYSGMTEAEAKAGTATEAKLISAATLDAAIENKGYTDNTGTITGIKMNGVSVGTEGVVDLGTVIKEHQDISGKLDASLKGQANGLAELDAEGKVPAAQLPSYVDDVVEYNGQSAFPATGESGKIYVDISTNKTYRWSGSAYVAVSTDIALGTTSSTAFRGDYGQAAYTHAVTNKGSAYTSGLYKITTNSEGHVTGATAVEKSDITSLGIPAQDTTYSDATTAVSGLMSASDKAKLTGIDEGAQVNVLESISVNGSALNPTNKGVNVTVPTAMSDLTNDGDFVSDANYVHTDSNFTSAEKEKLAGIASGAQVNSITGVKGNSEASYRTGNVNLTKDNIGLGNVENKSSETIRGELTKKNVTDALGYTPPETDTSYETMTVAEAEAGTATTGKMISAAVLDAAIENKGYTDNVGTITGITMNGVSKGTSGTVDLGTVITAHQDISGKADKTATVSTVAYDGTNKKITKTINGTTSDVVTASTLKSDMSLDNVENKSSATIRSELTKANVTTALGYTPPETDTTYESKAAVSGGTDLSLVTTGEKAAWNAKTSNTGTITGITMNGESKGTSGVVDLGTVVTDISGKLDISLKGASDGLAELDSSGKVPISQLPSYVDDVVEYSGQSEFPASGETGKIYVDTSSNKTYRWSGSAYVEISPSLALGTTSSTAYRGDYGSKAYKHAVTNKGAAFTSGLYKITTNAEGHVTAAAAVEKTDITGLGIPAQDTAYDTMTEAEAKAGTDTTAKTVTAKVLDAAITNKGYTTNTGTITGITMNGASKGTSGVVDLGTVITAHQDISGKADKTATVSDVTYDTTGKKLKKTINGTTSDVVSIADIKEDLAITKSDIGLGNVDNTSDANKPVSTAQQSALNLKVDKVTGKGLSSNDFTDALKTKLEGIEDGAEANVITGVKGEAESTYQTGNVILTKAGLGLGNVENTALSTWTGSANLTTSAQGDFGDVVTHSASDFAAASHGTHVTEQTVKSALGTGSGTTKFLREDGTWVKPENTTYESKTAASGGTAVSLVTTGEKYTWNSGIVPTGGTAGQFLKKKSSETDFDTEWDTVEVPTKVSDLTNDTGFITGMEILSYGSSTWNDFLAAYTAKKVVYCRASSNANPATGSQTRLAFMAYVSNADNPTNVEFQYYRSVSSHTASQQGDQVFVYKLDKTAGWTVTTREASSKIVAGTNMSSSYSNDTLTLNATDTTYESKAAASGGTDLSLVTTGEKYTWNSKGTYSKPSGGIPDSDIASAATWNAKGNGTITGITMNGVSKGTFGVVDLGTVITEHQSLSGKQDTLVSGTNIKTVNGDSLLGSGDLTVSSGALVVNCTWSSSKYNFDKTFQEISDAINSGVTPYVVYSNSVYELYSYTSSSIMFARINVSYNSVSRSAYTISSNNSVTLTTNSMSSPSLPSYLKGSLHFQIEYVESNNSYYINNSDGNIEDIIYDSNAYTALLVFNKSYLDSYSYPTQNLNSEVYQLERVYTTHTGGYDENGNGDDPVYTGHLIFACVSQESGTLKYKTFHISEELEQYDGYANATISYSETNITLPSASGVSF